ncbi:hypothetical protein BVRB_026620 [Beta vulgaris subsp. vulgaris]|uniref:Aspartyl/asparaginy/proline hydroxylase domain-containing protein n=1 Tax=Beta vulgaris subsp. vulgaris TaxID=3555 RepID=A0A0J8B207_BETVV|nr:hypothetical protein BVRB_026620 [Beta vulgaris subsp. vulgaris]
MFRAGDYQTSWRPGYVFVFDDVYTHEAWNYTNQERVSLILDFPRPGHLTGDSGGQDVGHGKGLEYLDSLTRQHGWTDI